MRKLQCLCCALILSSAYPPAQAQAPLTWDQVRQQFEQRNPTLLAGQFNISESKAEEITAYLRPNPNFTLTADQIDPFPGGPPHGPFAYLLPVASIN
jgi:outer membrane protein, heavy metal efflux system